MMRFIALLLAVLPPALNAAPRIVGGEDADPTRYPYYVAVSATVPGTGTFSCGGSLM
jgi:secreted trypsin-like serine protease